MFILENTPNSTIEEIRSYSYPKLYTGKEWYIGFMAYDPLTKRRKRKKMKLNHIEKISLRRKYADGLIKRLVDKLESGWNPWIEADCEKAYHTFNAVCITYRRYIDALFNDGLLRFDTKRDYSSKLKIIEQWNNQRKDSITYIYQFDRDFILDFLDYIYLDKGNTPQTRNNYLTFIGIFCSYLVEKNFLKTKPSDGISFFSKRKMKKIRTIINDNDIHRLYDFLNKENRYYLLACYIINYCFVRRKEMSYLKIENISLKKQTLFIPCNISKNGKGEIVTIPRIVIELMLDLKIFNYPSNYYIFSDNFMPGPQRIHEKRFTDYWSKIIRPNLNFPISYQFYSLKDTGITNMLRKYDVLSVRDQARHSSLEMTNKYTPYDIKDANNLIKSLNEFL